MPVKRIYLTGFMTSGKSTIGPILANVLGWNYYDLDKEIVASEKMEVVDIFEKQGEKYFRSIERKKLEELSKKENVVIALGGGTIANDENLALVKETGKMVYLKSSAEAIYRRIKHKTDRPIFKDLVLGENSKEDFITRINEMLSEREKYYNKSDLIIDTDSKNIGLTVDLIAKKITKLINEKN